MLPVYICEDNPDNLQTIRGYVENHIQSQRMDMKVVLAAGSPHEILNRIRDNPERGLYFLDLELPDMDGFQLAERIRNFDPRGFIVFITAHADWMPLTFKYKTEALDFIGKCDMKGLSSSIRQCLENVWNKCLLTPKIERFSIQTVDRKFVTMDYRSILFCEISAGSTHNVIINTEEDNYTVYRSLNELESELNEHLKGQPNDPICPDTLFFRCHKQYLVNVRKIKEFTYKENMVIMANEEKCLVGRKHVSTLKNLIEAFTKESGINKPDRTHQRPRSRAARLLIESNIRVKN